MTCNNYFHHKQLHRFLLILMAGIIVFGVTACSSSYKHKVLSFFFDGVPEVSSSETPVAASETKVDSSIIATPSLAAVAMNVHPPYQDKQCHSCHDPGKMGKLIIAQPMVCYACHDDFSKKYKNTHGPVEGGQCTMCHQPHQSGNEHLLTRKGSLVCQYCHESDDLSTISEHQDPENSSCMTCHDPHGGDNPYFIK